jgi:hypothetical protein
MDKNDPPIVQSPQASPPAGQQLIHPITHLSIQQTTYHVADAF